MHDIRYDAVHDEIFVNNPFAQAILVFRGSAQGEEPPIRIIQGPKTRIVRINQIQMQTTKGWIVATQPGKYEEQEPEVSSSVFGVSMIVATLRHAGSSAEPRAKSRNPGVSL